MKHFQNLQQVLVDELEDLLVWGIVNSVSVNDVTTCLLLFKKSVTSYEIQLPLPSKRLLQLHDVFLPQHPQHFDFTESSFSYYIIIFRLFELLNRNEFSCFLILALEHDAVGALADHT